MKLEKFKDFDYETKKKSNILMLTSHIYDSKKQAGFHHLANSFLGMGSYVTFCTVPNSILEISNSIISTFFQKSDRQIFYICCLSILYSIVPKKQGKLTKTSYISFIYNFSESSSYLSFLYKIRGIVNLDNLLRKIFLHGYSETFSNKYDVIIFESTVGLFLFDKLQKFNPNAKLIYRVSDDLELFDPFKGLIDYEKMIINKFDLISSTSSIITKKITAIMVNPNKIITQYHGIDKQKYDQKYRYPYDKNKKNLVFVGTGFMDEEFLKIVSNINQDWMFHIIGNLPKPVISQNIIYYGEMPFDETIPYLKFADVGLQIRSNSKGIETLEKSLKFIQYTYLKLPIIAPKYMNLNDTHIFSYEHTKESIENAINQALSFNHKLVDSSMIMSWDEIATEMLKYAGV